MKEVQEPKGLSLLKLHSSNRGLIHGGDDWENKILNATLFGPIDGHKFQTPNLVHRADIRNVSDMVHGMISFNNFMYIEFKIDGP